MCAMRVLGQERGIWAICVLLGLGLTAGYGCPSDCVCKWKGGKQTVECVNRTLRTFPPTIDPGTQVLDVSGNSFETLPPDHFMRSGLVNVQKVYLAKCRLSHVNSRAFRGLSNLVDLDLSSNLLREVPSAAFGDCQGLMRLVLSGNPIHHIQKRAFVALQALTSLEISQAGLELIEHGAFEGLHSLEWLKLEGNRLRRVSGLGVLPLGLKGVWLEDNPWQCDCQLLELRIWLGDRNVANSVEPRCIAPDRLVNATLRSLPFEAFACMPQLSPTTMYQKIVEGRNVSLLCKVSSIPESSIEWLFNSQPLSNSSLNLLVETSNAYPSGPLSSSSMPLSPHASPIEKKSELLILNATSDENGTFLCVARNPAGTAMANFTLRVLTRYDTDPSAPPEYSLISSIPLFVSSYPNLFIIALSTIAVILLVVVVLLISLLICKCSKICINGRARKSQRNHSKKELKDLKDAEGSKNLERHLSETSTLTTKTQQSNGGSVFLLSDLGDSNPDLIEGVRRVEGDGVEHNHTHTHNQPLQNCSQNGFNTQQQSNMMQYATLGRNPSGRGGAVILEPAQFGVGTMFPMEYGLPSSAGIGGGIATIRRSPSFPSGHQHQHQGAMYDLAKYPKAYGGSAYYNPSTGQEFYTSSHPTFILPPGSYLTTYSSGGGEGDAYGYNNVEDPRLSVSVNCSCAPIMEEHEGAEVCEGLTGAHSDQGQVAKSDTATSPLRRSESESLSASVDSPKGVGVKSTVARLQRQLTAVVNESPDEGYEDGGAEGTEI